MKNTLVCHNLHKYFGGNHVLRGIDFTLEAGECLALLGPSGCGKSTLLYHLAGSLAADEGKISLGGKVLDEPAKGIFVPMQKRGFAMVFQDFSLWPHFSVKENVGYGLKVRGVAKAERQKRVRKALAQVQMESFAERKPMQLSGGQQQRVAIARALVVEPDLLLLDEPLSALDARLRVDLRMEIGRLIRETGLTAVYVTHDQSEAFTIGDKVGLMYEGKLVQMEAPEKIYREPQTRFAAEFLGVANIWDLRESDENSPLKEIQAVFRETTDLRHILLRREKVRVENGSREPVGPGYFAWEGVCRKVDFLGEQREVEVETPSGLRVRGLSEAPLQPGAQARVVFAKEALRGISG